MLACQMGRGHKGQGSAKKGWDGGDSASDYFCRLITADYRLGKNAFSFFLYPITPMAIIDLLSILPSGVITAGYLEEISRKK